MSPSKSETASSVTRGAGLGQGDEDAVAIVARSADFAELGPARTGAESSPLSCLLNVTVNVTVELGRTTLTIGEILKSGPGSILQLNRAVSEPVDLMVQGVRFASGEVVVVDDHFAIRIKELAEPKKKA
jgi:flagellar motor switch protein FliN/FliY